VVLVIILTASSVENVLTNGVNTSC